jgi:hypothetical protein
VQSELAGTRTTGDGGNGGSQRAGRKSVVRKKGE